MDSLKNKDSYNEDAEELCDRIAESIQAGKNLVDVHEKFNRWLSECELDVEEEAGIEEGETGGVEMAAGKTAGEGGSAGGTEAGDA